MSVSVVISTFNRAEKLQACLESVKGFADEIVVVDNTSTDNTVSLAKKYTKHVFTRPNNPMLNINKNFGFTKATKDWILCLDDDEVVTLELALEIQRKVATDESDDAVNGYWIPRKNIIFGKWIQHTGWYPDYQLRLFRKGKGKFPEVHVHEMVDVEGKVDYLTSAMQHANYGTIHEFLYKMVMTYAPNEAEVLMKKGYVFDIRDSIRFPAREFLSRYFARQGYKDGLHGLMLSLLMAFYHLVVFGYIWEKQKFPSVEYKALEQQLSEEMHRVKKDMQYWSYTKKIEGEKNTLKKIIFKVRRKTHV